MNHSEIIDKTVKILQKLPKEKAEEISDFADYLLQKYEETIINKNILELSQKGSTYDFFKDDDVYYSVSDARKKYGE